MKKRSLHAPVVRLGDAGPTVSRLIFGTEHIIDRSPRAGGAVLAEAHRRYGINHWDTAPSYDSHPQVASGLRQAGRENVVVTSKISAETEEEAGRELDGILEELEIDCLDIALLHGVPTGHLARRQGALRHLVRARERGIVGCTGISSHSPPTLAEAVQSPDIDVVCGTLNRAGSHIDDGDLEDMLRALEACHSAGKGVYVIKVLGRGDLADDVRGAIEFVCQYPFIHAYNIGMRDIREVEENLEWIMRSTGTPV
ncbi:MAG: aldo/keto reductase [Bacillota bacterium]